MAPPFDLRRYGALLDFLQDREARDGDTRRQPFWLDVTNDWARDELGLDDDDREYFVAGLNLVVDGVYPKTRHWLDEPANPDLDDEIWLFARVWLDHYGPFRETTR